MTVMRSSTRAHEPAAAPPAANGRRAGGERLWEDRHVPHQEALDFYASPGRFTTLDDGEFSSADVREVVDVVQGQLVYDVVASPFYGSS
jgi:hypothetical protein